MDEIIIQVLLRRQDVDKEKNKEKLGSCWAQIKRFGNAVSTQNDVFSDFIYWATIMEVQDFYEKESMTIAVLVFAIIGLLLLLLQMKNKIETFTKGSPETTEKEGWTAWELAIIPLEDLPQLVLVLLISNHIGFTTGALYTFWSGFISLCLKSYSVLSWLARGLDESNEKRMQANPLADDYRPVMADGRRVATTPLHICLLFLCLQGKGLTDREDVPGILRPFIILTLLAIPTSLICFVNMFFSSGARVVDQPTPRPTQAPSLPFWW